MHWVVLILLFFLGTINFADKAVAGLASVSIMKELGLSYTDWGLVSSSFSWLYAIGGIIIAGWSDRIGTKKVLAFMALAWTVSQVSAYAISGMALLMVSRIWLGAFEGAYYACAISQMAKWFPEERRGFATSIINAGSTVGSFVAAPLLVYLVQNHGWRHAFGFLGLLSLVWVVLWMVFGKEKPADKSFIVEKPREKVKWSEMSHVLLSKTFIWTILAYIGFFWFLTWTTSWMPAYLQKVVHMTPKQMGNASVIIGIVSLFVSIGICVYSDYLFKKTNSLRKSRVLVAGCSLILAGLLFFSTTFYQSAVWVIIVLSLGKGLAFTISPLGAQIMISLFPEMKGLLVGSMVAIGSVVGGIIGPWITGILIDSAGQNLTLGFNYSILCFTSLLFIFGAIFAFVVKPDKKVNAAIDPRETVTVN